MNPFKVGDWVELNAKWKHEVQTHYGNTPDLQNVYLGKLQIIKLRTDSFTGKPQAGFLYPAGCRYGGSEYYWDLEDLELCTSVTTCNCPIALLLNRGCKCGAFKAEKSAP